MVTLLENIPNPRKNEYEKYLTDHINNVKRSYEKFIKPIIPSLSPLYVLAEKAIASHDLSKYDPEEFDAYLNHYYPADYGEIKKGRDDAPYQVAWLTHIHKNKHHWQHWILVHDEGDITVLDMPEEEVINMLCDWHSFSAKDPTSTAFKWYQDNGDSMILSRATRDIIDTYIGYLREPL